MQLFSFEEKNLPNHFVGEVARVWNYQYHSGPRGWCENMNNQFSNAILADHSVFITMMYFKCVLVFDLLVINIVPCVTL